MDPSDDAVSEALGDFGTRRGALDYGFFKLNVPGAGVALLVDFIVRRGRGLLEVRASVHAPSGSGVHRCLEPLEAVRLERPGAAAALVVAGAGWLGARGSQGTLGPVSWNLAFRASGPSLRPLPEFLARLGPTDMVLASAPEVRLDGEISLGDARFPVRDAPGLVSSYHGRRLPDRWLWISCNAFDRGGVAVECMVLSTRLYGLPGTTFETGYLDVRAGDLRETLVAPIDGSLRVERRPDGFRVLGRRRGAAREVRLACRAGEDGWHDLGEGIRNTLLGDCELEGVARAAGTAGLEERSESGQRR